MTTKEELHIEAELAKLINLSGKMRMLSHRAFMLAMILQRDDGEGNVKMSIAFNKALNEFREIAALFGIGSGQTCSEATLSFLTSQKAIKPELTRAVAHFEAEIARFRRTRGEYVTTDELERLADYVGSELLTELNGLNQGVQKALEKLLENRAEQEKKSRDVILSAIDNVDQVTEAIRLVAVNAVIEAARAGKYGHGFSVIAAEITNLSESSLNSVSRVKRRLKELR